MPDHDSGVAAHRLAVCTSGHQTARVLDDGNRGFAPAGIGRSMRSIGYDVELFFPAEECPFMKCELESQRLDSGIVLLRLLSPGRSVVVLDQWLLDQLNLFLDEFERNEPPAGFILASASARVFVAGADLAEIDSLSDEALAAYLTEGVEAFARIATMPCPTAAVINGAALGGGLEIALHCDALFASLPEEGAKPYRIGLPEASLGLCPGWGGTQMLPARIDAAQAIEMMTIGFTPTLDEFPDGLFERIVDNEADLIETAVRWIDNNPKDAPRKHPISIDESNRGRVREALEKVREALPDTPASHAVVEAVETGIEDGWAAGLAAERRLLISLRHTPIARTKLESFFAKKG